LAGGRVKRCCCSYLCKQAGLCCLVISFLINIWQKQDLVLMILAKSNEKALLDVKTIGLTFL
jgi:hypothetical protein